MLTEKVRFTNHIRAVGKTKAEQSLAGFFGLLYVIDERNKKKLKAEKNSDLDSTNSYLAKLGEK